MRLTLFGCVVAGAAVLWLSAGIAAWAAEPDTNASPLAVLTGNDSHMTKRTYERVSSPADWRKTWLNHLGLKDDTIYRPAMEVDFTRCEVVAVFGGESWNSCGFLIEAIVEKSDLTVVRFDDISYQTAGPDGGGDRVTPFAFAVLPKSEKTITLENNVQPYKRGAAQWQEVARLAPLRN